ncbi:MAG TPA: ROK family protein [Polyangiaceae bacterium]|nr:ROK family protein [Polyangiaceae bacterium]
MRDTASVQGKVDSRAMREINRSIVLDIIRRGGKVSRTDLAKRSALTKPTVSAIVDDLLARGIVQEVGYGRTMGSGGRRARLLEFNDASAAYLGIRFGVRTTQVGIADARGGLRVVREIPSAPSEPERAVREALALVDSLLAEANLPRERLQSAGVAIPALVSRSGVVELAPNLNFKQLPLRELVQEGLGLPVVVMNDTHAGALAEGRCGAARGVRSFVWVQVGTGVGAGIVIDGKVFHGHVGFSGEIGHCPVIADGPVCSCGLRGCLEAVASGWAIRRAADAAVASGEASLLAAPGCDREARAVAEAARAGDAVACRILSDVGAYLGMGISTLVNLLNPEMIVLGGGVMSAPDHIIEAAQTSMAKHALRGADVRIVPGMLGERVGLVGALLGAMDLSVRSLRVVAGREHAALE